MIRRNALLRLHQHLLGSRDRLRKKLAAEAAYLHYYSAADATHDSADLAFEADGDEMSSRLTELGDKELSQIDRALARWNQGGYGVCESCQKPIALPRLNALPYTPLCISCEREMEKSFDAPTRQSMSSWGEIIDAQESLQDERIEVSELERELSRIQHR